MTPLNTVIQIHRHLTSTPLVSLFDQQAWIAEHLVNKVANTDVDGVFKLVVMTHPLNGMAFSMADDGAAKAFLASCSMVDAAPFADVVTTYCHEALSKSVNEAVDTTLRNATSAGNLAFMGIHSTCPETRAKVARMWPLRTIV